MKQVIVVFGLQSLINESSKIPLKLIEKSVDVVNDEGNSQVCELFDVNPDYILWDTTLLDL